MAMNTTTTRIVRASSSSASSPSSTSSFLTNLFGGSTASTTVRIIPAAEITDWEFINTSDAADDDDLDVLDVLSDVEESETKLSSGTRSVSSSIHQNNSESESDRESDPGIVSGLAVVTAAAHMKIQLQAALDRSHGRFVAEEDQASEDEADQEEEEEDDDVDLDDELVTWGMGEKLGRQRMRKCGTRAYASKKTTKKFAYTVKSRGCVSGKHGLGRKA